MSARIPSFVYNQRLSQADFLARTHAGHRGYRGAAYRLAPDQLSKNLAPSIGVLATEYFAEKGITWHIHASHALSSQVCCLNFLMPLAHQREALAKLIGHALGIAPPEMLPMERDAAGNDWYVAFEWIGERDHLNETGPTGKRTRGANVTSADAAVRFRHEGQVTMLLIEWKYTESYGAPLKPDGNPTRVKRYQDIAFAPAGPIRADLGLTVADFFWEPFYQLLRQQMLAFHMQRAHEGGADSVRVLHISPAANSALHKVTAPALRRFGDDAFDVFKSVLTQPDDFIGWTAEALFGQLLKEPQSAVSEWSTYLLERYDFLSPAREGAT